jgi:MFS family permease
VLAEYRKIPGEAKYIVYASFFPSLAVGIIYTDLAYFLTKVQGLSDLLMGTIIMVMGITTVLSSTPLGILGDRYGRRRFLIIGNVLASLTLTIFALTTNVLLLFVAAVVEGLTEGAFFTLSTALLAEKAGNESRTPAFSLVSALGNIAWSLGGFALPVAVLLQSFGLDDRVAHVVLYLAFAGVSLASTLLLLRVGESQTERKKGTKKSLLPRKSKGVLVRWGVPSVIVAFGAGLFVPLMSRWFYLAYGLSDAVSGPILGISGLLIAVATLAAPALARKFGLIRSIVLTQGLSTLFMFTTPLSPTYAIAGTVYSVRSFMMNLSNPLTQSMVMGLVSEDERGAASGISASLWRFPNSISTTIGAGLMGAGFLAQPFYLATVLYLVAIISFWFFFRKARLPEEMTQHGRA